MATHELTVDGDTVTKRFTSWARGEHEREWLILGRLHRHTTDLVPRPLQSGLGDDRPWLTMTLLPGTALAGSLSAGQLDRLEAALRQLWAAPADALPPRRFHPAELVANLRWDDAPTRGVVAEAVAAARMIETGESDGPPVIGHGDPNLANYLWDGHQVRIVDFEDAGASMVEYELASLIEHRSAVRTNWQEFATRFDIDPNQLLAGRQLNAALWLHMLLRRGSSAHLMDQQAGRLLDLMAGRTP